MCGGKNVPAGHGYNGAGEHPDYQSVGADLKQRIRSMSGAVRASCPGGTHVHAVRAYWLVALAATEKSLDFVDRAESHFRGYPLAGIQARPVNPVV